jgi:methyl-accepting chemotaxis protein
MTIKRALHGALHPGVRVLARLSYPKKLTLLAVLLAIPAVYAGWAYTGEQNAKITFSDKERVGVRYVQPVTALLAKLVTARHDAVAAAAAGRPAQAPDMQREVGAVAAVDRELGAELQTTNLWHDLQQKIDVLTSQPPSGAQTAFDAYSEVTAGTQALIVQAGDTSNLILDPDLDSFYVMDAIITKLPAIADTLGRAGDRLLIHGGGAGVDERIELAVDNGIVKSAAAATMTGFATSFKSTKDRDLRRELEAPLKDLAAQIDGAAVNVEHVVRGDATVGNTSTAAAADLAAEMNAKLPAHLDRLLAARIGGFNAASNRIEVVLVLGLAIALYAFASLYLLVTRSLREIAEAADGLAEGDVDQRIKATSRDEVGRVASALARIIEYLKAAAGAAERIADADLTIDVEPRSERDALGTSLATMTTNLRQILGEVSNTAETLSAASQEMASTSEEAGRAVGEIADSASEVAIGAERQVRSVDSAKSFIESVASATTQSAATAQQAAGAAEDARRVAHEGTVAVRDATDAMAAVRETSEQGTAAIRSLGVKNEQIGGIVDTITGIAEQTNMLALNAAIEAARAGEQGRGFAVVAEEVRRLAENSQTAAASIAELISDIQSETTRAISVVESGGKRTDEGAATVEQAREAFERIGHAVENVTTRVSDIALSVEHIATNATRIQTDIDEVAAVTEQTSAATQQVSASAEETSASTQQIASSAQDLARTAEKLTALVARFQLAA